ncbi:PREDICTED: FK506-binding protein 3-like [Ipomoea nil]|uniref:FK506-binding protein 3-like n=1 Tax=Ipomoea nil TaxID=35883 RepID=UPI000901244F|nr:PREDICTED: FK506-binding protein 3-like [Ipomoea nil]
MDTEASHLSIPQEPCLPAKMKEVAAELTEVPSLPQEPTFAEQVPDTLTQEPALVAKGNREIPPEVVITPPVVAPIPPSPNQLLRESIENDYNRVLQWQKWHTAPLDTFIETFEAMKDEEKFALEWIGTKDVNEALRLETIRRVFSYKMTNRTLGKDKAPICIKLNKPPLDPAFEEEMKMVRYAILISKVKTILEKEHQNGPNCNVSGLKDEQGREIDTAEEEDEKSNEKDEGKTDDVEDADDENDDDDDDNDDSGNDGDNGADPTYDSESPLLVGPDYDTVPERSPAQKSPNSDDTREASHQDEDISTDHPEDMSRALVPHVQPMDETPIK